MTETTVRNYYDILKLVCNLAAHPMRATSTCCCGKRLWDSATMKAEPLPSAVEIAAADRIHETHELLIVRGAAMLNGHPDTWSDKLTIEVMRKKAVEL